MRRPPDTKRRLTMRLSDAGLRRPKTKLIYPNHRPPPWPNEDATPRSLEPIVRRPHTLTLVRAITLAHLPAYTADWLLRNLRFEQPGVSKCGLSGGAFALTSTLESTPTRTLEAHWRCPFNLCHPLRCRRGFPSFQDTVQRRFPSGALPRKRCGPRNAALNSPAHDDVSIEFPRPQCAAHQILKGV